MAALSLKARCTKALQLNKNHCNQCAWQMNTSAMEGYKCQTGAFIKTALKCSRASCPCSGLLQGRSCGVQGQEALHVLVTSLAPMTEQGKSLSPCAQEAFGFPLPSSNCPQDEARGWVHMRCCLSQQ